MPKCLSNSASGFIRRHNNITKRKKAIIKNKKNMKRLLTILAAVVMSNALVWADKRAEGDALYEKFAHWGLESKADTSGMLSLSHLSLSSPLLSSPSSESAPPAFCHARIRNWLMPLVMPRNQTV